MRFFLKPVTSLLVAVALFALMASQSTAQGIVKSTHGDWQLVCDTPAGAPREQCALMQTLIDKNRPELGLNLLVIRTLDRENEYLRIQTPLGVLLPFGVGLVVDGKDFGRAYFVRCFQDGCYVEVELRGELLKTLQAGSQAYLSVFPTPEEGVGFPVDLNGFSEGYSRIP
ncbi:MAG: invasion associated locus B family protein [Pseudomonadota bacterium]